MNLSISIARVVFPESADYAKFAIYPIIVSSPVLNTMPIPSPFTH